MPDDGTQAATKLAPERQRKRWLDLRALATRVVPRQLLVERGRAHGRRVALTFDDGPHEMTGAYLDVLDRHRARATFFVVGECCAERRQALLDIVARGHEVAGHGYTHQPFPGMDRQTLRDELARTAALIPPTPSRPLVRPPRGATSLRSLALSAQAGYTTVLWSRDSDDCRTTSADDVAARLRPETIRPGEIVLLHEGQSWTLAALPRVLEAFAAAGWSMVTVGEILNAGPAGV
jgi:peptidoglycan/xylan/chitin deacetylase (PgdA/CDA1 family)